jgi:DNA-binding MarR family transcriptional regulator
MEAAKTSSMRQIRLTGREATVVRAIGFAEPMLGSEIQDYTRMEGEDVTDTLNSLMAAGFVESIPYSEEIQLAEMPVTQFEVNPGYVQGLKDALRR